MPQLPKYFARYLLYALLGLTAVTLLTVLFRPSPLSVEVGTVERGALQVTVDEEGRTRMRDRFTISAPIAGRLNRIDLDPGDPVQQGERVAQIDPLPSDTQVQAAQARLQELRAQRAGVETQRPKQAALEQAQARIRTAQANQRQAEARVAQAEAALQQAQRDRQRAQELAAEGAIPQQERETAELTETTRARALETARREVDALRADVTAAQQALTQLQQEQSDPDYLLRVYDAQIAAAQADLANLADEAARTDMRSPVTGQVLRVLQESARFVEAGTPVLEVGNTRRLEVVIDVLSSDAVRIQPGNPVLIEQWGGDTTLEATVRQVEPSAFTKVSALGVEEQRVNVIADFVDQPRQLGDGFRVDARIVTWEGSSVLQVPISSLFRCDDDWCVFVVEQGKAKQQPIEVGHRNNLAAEVEHGLQEGTSVILYPSEQVTEGRRVEGRSQ